MGYTWKPQDVFRILEINIDKSRTEQYIVCPKCGKKRLRFNMEKGVGKCWETNCEFACDSARFYAVMTGLSVNEARKDIESKLRITSATKVRPRSENYIPRDIYSTDTIANCEEEIASANILDDTYNAFLAELTLSDKHRFYLKARGFSDDQIEMLNYKTFPRHDEIDFCALCRRLQREGYTLKGVPGFYKNLQNEYTFVQITKGIIVPQVGFFGRKEGLEVYKDDDLRVYIEEKGDYEDKISGFSSKGRYGGCRYAGRVHFSCDFKLSSFVKGYEPVIPEDGIILTDGIMKADITNAFSPNMPVMSVPNVSDFKLIQGYVRLLKEYGVKQIWIAYDMSYKNIDMEKICKQTTAIVEQEGIKCTRMEWKSEISIHCEDGKSIQANINGIDDYLACANLKIIPKVKSI